MSKSSEIRELLRKGVKQKDIAEKLKVSKAYVSRLNSELKSESESKDPQIKLTEVNQKLTELANPLDPKTENNDHNSGPQVNPVNQKLTLTPGKTERYPGPITKIQIKEEIRHLANLLGVSSKFYKEEGFKGTLEIREHISSLLDQL